MILFMRHSSGLIRVLREFRGKNPFARIILRLSGLGVFALKIRTRLTSLPSRSSVDICVLREIRGKNSFFRLR